MAGKPNRRDKITKLFQVAGRVINSETRLGVADLKIEAWHKDEPLEKTIGPQLQPSCQPYWAKTNIERL
jgi:hypothetical protein